MSDAILFPPAVIRASAGTGKTFQLSNRFIRLLVSGVSPDRILATTFTRKAAGEIEERVLLRLAKACSSDEEARTLSAQIGMEVDSERCRRLLADVARLQHRLAICTLDSLCTKIALGFALELGLPLEWRILDESEAAELRADSIERMLSEEEAATVIELVRFSKPASDYGRSVHKALVDHISAWHDYFREASGTDAWLWLDPPARMTDEQLARALDALRDAELPKTAKGDPDKRVSDAREKLVHFARAGDWEKASSGALVIAASTGGKYGGKELTPSLAEACKLIGSEGRARLLHRMRQEAESAYHLLRLFDRHHSEASMRGGLLGFSDVKRLLAAAEWLGSLEHVYYRLDSRIDHLLLDEFQDTSGSEWKVVEPIGREIRDRMKEGRSLFAVGDVKQAIYGWRGGVAEIFDTLEDTWELEPSSLDKSFRSGPQVIETVNRVFSTIEENEALKDHKGAAARWAKGFEAHTAHRSDRVGHVRLQVGSEPPEGMRDSLVQDAAKLVRELAVRHPDREIGVLVRTNNNVARLIYEIKCEGEEIGEPLDVSEEGGSPLTDSAAVCAALSLLELADHPGNKVARYHVARSPLGEAIGYTHHEDDGAADELSERIRLEIAERGLGRFVWKTIGSILSHASERDRSRLMQLSDLAHAHKMGDRLSAFVELVRHKRMEAPGAAQIRVMTIHQAKGLEFDIVVLPDLEGELSGRKGPAPTILSERPSRMEPPTKLLRCPKESMRALHPEIEKMHAAMVEDSMVEALCVLYVALTRAKRSMYMLVAPVDKLPSSHAGIVRSALSPGNLGSPGDVLFEIGAPPGPNEEAAPQEPRPAIVVKPSASLSGTQRRRRGFLKRTASPRPTGFVGAGLFDAAKRGTTLHGMLEYLEWLDDGTPDPVDVPGMERLSEEERERAVSVLTALTSKESVRELLSRTAYAGWGVEDLKLHRERAFAVLRDGEVVTGAIDRLVVGSSGGRPVRAEIIDFKSGAASDDKAAFYREQLLTYRSAVSKMLSLDESAITCKLLFMGSGEIRVIGDG